MFVLIPPTHNREPYDTPLVVELWRRGGGLRCRASRREAEGLTLRVADNKTGYFGVNLDKPGQPKPYQARVWRGGKNVHLGSFATAEEAALCVARSPEGRAAAAERRRRSGGAGAAATGERGGPGHGPRHAARRRPQGGGRGPAHAARRLRQGGAGGPAQAARATTLRPGDFAPVPRPYA